MTALPDMPAPPGIRLIRGGAHHCDAVSELHSRCFDEPWSAYTVRQVLTLSNAFGILAVPASAAVPPDLLGFSLCRAVTDECELLSLAVAAPHRGSGIGAALLANSIFRARSMGVRRLFLEVAEDNAGAQNLYRSFGFSVIGRRPGYYRRLHGPPMTALTMALGLGDGRARKGG